MTTATITNTKTVVAANLRAMKGYSGKSDTQIAAELGESRNWVNERMVGRTECKATDIVRFANYFNVPVERLFDDWMTPGSTPYSAWHTGDDPGHATPTRASDPEGDDASPFVAPGGADEQHPRVTAQRVTKPRTRPTRVTARVLRAGVRPVSSRPRQSPPS